MTTSKSDLEAKEGQPPNESNFLEFVSLLGSLSTRAGGSSMQEEAECKEENGDESKQAGECFYLLESSQDVGFSCIFTQHVISSS